MVSFGKRIRHSISLFLQGAVNGKAFYSFAAGRFAEAAKILEKDLQKNPDQQDNEISLSVLGRCYLELNQTEKALSVLEESYLKFQRNGTEKSGQEYLKRYQETIYAYSKALRISGRLDESIKILNNRKRDFE
jgi:tetratricopeptide (TPR) repeat protein